MIGRRRVITAMLGGGAALPAASVSAARRRRRVQAAAASPWVVRLGGAGGLRYDIDFRRGEMGAPPHAFDRQRGIRLVGTVQGEVTFMGVGAPHVVGDVAVQAEQPVDVALQCAGVLLVRGGATRWAVDVRVSLGDG